MQAVVGMAPFVGREAEQRALAGLLARARSSPDHSPLLFAGCEVVEFSPSVELQQTMAVVGQNLEATKAAMAQG